MVCVNEGALPLFIVVLRSVLENIPWDPACNRRGGGTRRRHVVARGERRGAGCGRSQVAPACNRLPHGGCWLGLGHVFVGFRPRILR